MPVSIAVKAPSGDRVQLRLAPWVAVVLWLVVGLLTGCTITLRVTTGTGAFGEPWYLAALGDLALFMLPTVGLVIAVRRPQLVFGWLMLVAALAFAGGELAHAYATQALMHPGTLPGGMAAAFFQSVQLIGFVVLPQLLLLFPDGRLPTPRWKPLAWAAVVVPAVMLPVLVLTPGLMLDGVPATRNPFGLQALQGTDIVGQLFAAWYLILLLALASLLLRFRRARGQQRQQLKWVMFGGALFPISFFIEELDNPTLNAVADLLAIAAFCGAIGLAILRHRLYEIDRLVNRTLVYAVLTALLAGVYAGVVLVLGQLFGGIGAEPPSWAIAGATLAVAALIQPARRRIQAMVDRRFNRRRYDAVKTIEVFNARLRDELDLDTLSAELLAVVNYTMQPTQSALWLRPSAKDGGLLGTLTHEPSGEATACRPDGAGDVRAGHRTLVAAILVSFLSGQSQRLSLRIADGFVDGGRRPLRRGRRADCGAPPGQPLWRRAAGRVRSCNSRTVGACHDPGYTPGSGGRRLARSLMTPCSIGSIL